MFRVLTLFYHKTELWLIAMFYHFLILYLVRKPATPSKRNIEEDILFQQDTLTQSIKVIGIPSSRLWIIFFTALISLLAWFGLDAIFPDARTSKSQATTSRS